MKKFLLSLATVAMCAGMTYAAETTILAKDLVEDPNTTTTTDNPLPETLTSGNFEFTFAKNNGSTAPAYNKAGDIRIYAKGSMTVKTLDGTNMTEMTFFISTAGKKRLTEMTVDTGTCESIGEEDWVVVWTGDASEVTFTVGEKATLGTEGNTKAGQFDWYEVTIVTKDGEVNPPAEEEELQYTANVTVYDDEDYITEWGCDGAYLPPLDAPTAPTVDVYETYFVIKAWCGAEGYDLKVEFDEEENVLAITPTVAGVEKDRYDIGYANCQDASGNAFMAYIGTGYSYAGANEEGGYLMIPGYYDSKYILMYYGWDGPDAEVANIAGTYKLSLTGYDHNEEEINREANVLITQEGNQVTIIDLFGDLLLSATEKSDIAIVGTLDTDNNITFEPQVLDEDSDWFPVFCGFDGEYADMINPSEDVVAYYDEATQTITMDDFTVAIIVDFNVEPMEEGDDDVDPGMGVDPNAANYMTVFYGMNATLIQGGSAVKNITNSENAPVEFYTLQGVKVNRPEAAGIYIVRQGEKTAKVVIR